VKNAAYVRPIIGKSPVLQTIQFETDLRHWYPDKEVKEKKDSDKKWNA